MDIQTLRARARQQQRGRFVKVCLLGDIGVGKTSLAIRFMHGRFFERYRPNCYVNHFVKKITSPDFDFNMLIWDTAGAERFRAVTSQYVRGASSVILVFDVTHRPSYEHLTSYWLPKIEHWQPGVPVVLVASKVDQTDHANWAVSLKEILKFCATHKLRFYETSAKTGENVEGLFLDAGNITGETPYSDDECDIFMDSFQLLSGPHRKMEDDKKGKKKPYKCCNIL